MCHPLTHAYICMYALDMEIIEVQAKSILTPQHTGSLSGHYDYSLNPYAGCAFACSYCYVPKFPSKKDRQPQEWGGWLEVKENAPQLIRKDRAKVFGSSIFFSSATDPYQYAELKYRLTRQCLSELLHYHPGKLTLHTRSHLVLQDLELLKKFDRNVLSVGVSFTTNDDTIRQEFEPKAPSIQRRMELIKALHQAGISVTASIAPILPCQPDELVSLLKPYVNKLWVGTMNYPEINNRPDLLEKYKDFFTPLNQGVIAASIKKQFSA